MALHDSSSSDNMEFEIVVVPQVPTPQPDPIPSVDRNSIQFIRVLGSGTYGTCSLVHRWNPKTQRLDIMAMKQAKSDVDVKEKAIAFLENEIDFLNRVYLFISIVEEQLQLEHRGVVSFFFRVTDPNDHNFRAFLMEFLIVGNVYKYYTGQSGQEFLRFSEDMACRKRVCQELAEAIAYIHETGTIHGDISCNNVVLSAVDGRPTPKLCDFGTAINSASVLRREQIAGTYLYCSPEVYCRQDCTKESDVFSFGMLCYFIKHPLLEGDTLDDIKRACNLMHGLVRLDRGTEFSSHRPEINELDEFDQLFKRCWHEEPRRRITMEQFLQKFNRLRF